MKKVLTRRSLIGFICRLGSVSQKIGISPKSIPGLPGEVFAQTHSGIYSPGDKPRARVAYFVGCGTNFMYPDTGKAVIQVLNQNNIEVIIPPGQVCCGIPVMAEGDLQSAVDMILTNIKIFEKLEVDAVITDCTSCGMMFKDKAAKLMPDNSDLQDRVVKVADKVWEVTDYLNNIGLTAKANPLPEKYSYHVPCHHGWNKGVKDAPRELLSKIPETQFEEMELPESCCGAAGTFFLNHKGISEKIRAKKIKNIKNTGAANIVTQCPVCRFYLASQLQGQMVMHPISFLAKAY